VKDTINQPGFPRQGWATSLKTLIVTLAMTLVSYFYFGLGDCSLGIVGFGASSCKNMSSDGANTFIGFGLLGLGIVALLFLVFVVMTFVAALNTAVWFLKRDR
jgi:uncharacterized membrane protein